MGERVAAREFVQYEPARGAPSPYGTEALVMYDDRTRYVAFRSPDPEPPLAELTQRDADLFSDDAVIVLLDSHFDRQTAYYFITNPRGALIADGLDVAIVRMGTASQGYTITALCHCPRAPASVRTRSPPRLDPGLGQVYRARLETGSHGRDQGAARQPCRRSGLPRTVHDIGRHDGIDCLAMEQFAASRGGQQFSSGRSPAGVRRRWSPSSTGGD
jgi:hypothetical protein